MLPSTTLIVSNVDGSLGRGESNLFLLGFLSGLGQQVKMTLIFSRVEQNERDIVHQRRCKKALESLTVGLTLYSKLI